jgi:hypothetical protein
MLARFIWATARQDLTRWVHGGHHVKEVKRRLISDKKEVPNEMISDRVIQMIFYKGFIWNI